MMKHKAGIFDKTFLKQVAFLTVPMALQNLINVGVMAADVIMIGRVGEKVLSAASLGGQVYFILNLLMFGTCSGASVLIAQYWGRQEITPIEKVMGIALRITLLAALSFFTVTMLVPGTLMKIFTDDPEVIAYGIQYLRIIAFTYPIEAFVLTYLNINRSIERVVISTVVYAVQLVANVIGNALLIYGMFGLPALGIRGAAIATLSARLIGFGITLCYALFVNKEVRVRVKYIFHTEKVLNQDFLHYALAVVFNEMLWGLGTSVTAAIIGHLGSSAVAAQSVASTIRQLAMVVSFGIAGSAAVMIGKEIGKNDIETAEQYGKNFLILGFVFGCLGGALILLLRPVVMAGMHFSGTVADYANTFMAIMAYYCIFASVNAVCIVGIFRAGGDTKIGLLLDCSTLYGWSVLVGFLAAFILKLPVKVVYVILTADEVIKAPLSYLRYKKKYWLHNVTRDFSEE